MKQLSVMHTETASSASVPKLVALLTKAKDSYYNSGEFYRARKSEFPVELKQTKELVTVTDRLYDKLEQLLMELDPKNKLLKSVRATGTSRTASQRIVKLKYPMGSLQKVRTESALESWATEHEGPYCLSDKIDGISLQIIYDGGEYPKLFTGSTLTTGQDVSHLAPYLKLPKLRGSFDLRGEIVMRKGTFNSKWATTYKNPRNMTSGLVNAKDVTNAAAVKDLVVLIYEVFKPRLKQSAALKWAKSKGFTVVAHKVVPELNVDKLTGQLIKRKASGFFEVDGLVIVQDKAQPLNREAVPDWGVAFKSELADDSAQATVVAVEWRLSRHGYLVPRIQVKPVRLNGVTVTYCSGKNAAFIRDNKINVGAVVKLRRSGDVIPDVKDGDVIKKATKAALPSTKYKWEWNESKTNIMLLDKGGVRNSDAQVKVLEHFFSTLGVERIKAATLQLFMDAGYQTISSIIRLNQNQFTKIPGANSTFPAVYDQLHEKLNDVSLPTLMDASNAFGRGFGTRRCSKIVQALPNIMKLAGNPKLVQMIDAVEGFDEKTATMFAEQLPKFVRWVEKLGLKPVAVKKVKVTSNKLGGQYVLFTGFRDADLEESIRKAGGNIANGISKTTILLAKDPSSGSSKMTEAKKRGIKIMTAETFRRKYGL